MKQLVFSLVGAVLVILAVIILLSLHSRDIRRVELERSLDTAAEQSLKRACITGTDEIGDNDAMVADFMSNFLGKMKSDGKDLEVDVMAADIYKGILSVKVTEKYTFPNGKEGKLTAQTTSIVERESRRPTVCTNYYIPWEVARDAGFDYVENRDFLYHTRRASEGYEKAADIKGPDTGNYIFQGWRSYTDADGLTGYMAVY